MRINIALHGRFYDFDLGAALLEQGHDVRLLTNYPLRVAARWFARDRLATNPLHGVLSRAAGTASGGEPPQLVEAGLKHMFGKWAARHNVRDMPDVVHCWSGIAEESLRACRRRTFCSVARGSSHIRAQLELLSDEEDRVGRKLEKPSPWIVAREEREYALAHRVIVGSTFARDTFIAQGHAAANVALVEPAARAPRFVADPAAIQARIERIRRGDRLRVLYAGLISFRKGMQDLHDVLRALGKRIDFRLVGAVMPECADFARAATAYARVEPAVPEAALPGVYAWGDVFVLPTIEDGYAVVLAQAQGAGLPIIATTNCGARDILAHGGQGWIVPIRTPDAIITQLEWCDANRDALAGMVAELHDKPAQRTWSDAARDFITAVTG